MIKLIHLYTKKVEIELIGEIAKLNPLGYNLENDHPFYSYKMKRFLTDIALGMMPSKVWTGELYTASSTRHEFGMLYITENQFFLI